MGSDNAMQNAEAPSSGERPSRHPAARLEALQAISQAIAQVASLEDLFRLLYRRLVQVLDVTGFILALYDEISQTVEVVRQIEAGIELPGGVFPLGSGFTSQVIRTGAAPADPPLVSRGATRADPVCHRPARPAGVGCDCAALLCRTSHRRAFRAELSA
jgi:hypothetical protein